MFNYLYLGSILASIYLLFMFLIVQLKKDNYVGNFTWGIGVALITLYTFFLKVSYLPKHFLITCLILLWAIRLGIYFYSRYQKGLNPKFIAWQQSWGKYALAISFFWVFVGQGSLMLVMSLPSILTNLSNAGAIYFLDIIGIIIWTIGFYFESVSDYQLFKFMKNPENKGKVCKVGLWRYSRHPNYFGEILMWWGIFLISVTVPHGIYAIIAPITITILLIFFTGIPINEAAMKDNLEYQEYKKTTNMLIPGKPTT